MTLTASISVAARGVQAQIEVPAGTTLALLGPNGSGKSTILEALAGLLPIDEGTVSHGGRTLVDTATGVDVPSRERAVAFVSQADSLFGSMTVLENVAFGLRARGTARNAARDAAHEWLDRVGAAELAGRRPHALSGGQARRVSLARALASGPRLILLDEPFAGLDLESATAIRALIREVLGGITTVVATHAALDAHVLADAVAVLDAGSVAERGPTAAVLARPHTRFAARMAGRVLLIGSVTPSGLVLDAGGAVAIAPTTLPSGARAAVAVHPRDIDITPVGLPDLVTALEPHGDLVRVHGAVLAADVEPAAVLSLRPGDPIRFSVRGEPSAYAV